MKIAIIVNPLIPVPPDQYGGIERIVYMLIKELQLSGNEVTVYAHPDSKPGCIVVPYRERTPYGLRDMIRSNILTSMIAFKRFDIVHTFGRMSNIALLMHMGLPKVVSYQLPPTLSQVVKAVRLAKRNTLYFTACSNYIADQIRPFCDVTTIYNGVDLDDYEAAFTVESDAPLVFLGRIQKEKGTAIAIEVARMTGNRLIIAGNIPNEKLHQQYFREEVEPFIDGRQISYIGPVNNSQKNNLLRGCKALLMPVLWDEPFGIVMTEALACGAPVIGLDRGAVSEVVQQGVNGYVCHTIQDMSAAVNRLDRIDRKACRETVENKFSSKSLAAQYETLYQRITANHKR
jgi:glycosyltransferase involved in cell wall biosynthesis